MADLTTYIVLRKWSPTQLAEAAVTVAAPEETWEPIGQADAGTGPKAIEAVLEATVTGGGDVSEDFEFRAVPTRYWGEVYGPTVKIETSVTVAPVASTAPPEREPEPEPEPEEQPELAPVE